MIVAKILSLYLFRLKFSGKESSYICLVSFIPPKPIYVAREVARPEPITRLKRILCPVGQAWTTYALLETS